MYRKKGFTLIELLVVIAIIGILATLVITQLQSARVKARNSAAKSEVVEGGKAIEVFKDHELANERVAGVGAAGGSVASITGSTPGANDLTAYFSGTVDYTDGTLAYPLRIQKTPAVTISYYYCPAIAADAHVYSTDGSYLFWADGLQNDPAGAYFVSNQTGTYQTDTAPDPAAECSQ
jgi:prepilin-type N-terminal cleavage/methylation domain-containing protein